MKHRTTEAMRERLQARILRNIEIDPYTLCWVWKGRVGNHGYGVMSVRVPGYRYPVKMYAHRVSYQVFRVHPRRSGEIAHHFKCVSRLCVHPFHLRATTRSANERDKKKAVRWKKQRLRLREIHPPVHTAVLQPPK